MGFYNRECSNNYYLLEIFVASVRGAHVDAIVDDVVEAIESDTHIDRVVVPRYAARFMMSVPVGRYLADMLADVLDLDEAAYDPSEDYEEL